MNKLFIQILGFCLVIGVLSVAVIVAGFFIGIVLSFLFPIALLFTGVGLLGFLCKDYDEDDQDEKSP